MRHGDAEGERRRGREGEGQREREEEDSVLVRIIRIIRSLLHSDPRRESQTLPIILSLWVESAASLSPLPVSLEMYVSAWEDFIRQAEELWRENPIRTRTVRMDKWMEQDVHGTYMCMRP